MRSTLLLAVMLAVFGVPYPVKAQTPADAVPAQVQAPAEEDVTVEPTPIDKPGKKKKKKSMQSKDFQQSHKLKKPAASATPAAPAKSGKSSAVKAEDLMKAMKDSIENPAQPLAASPATPAAAPVSPPVAVPELQPAPEAPATPPAPTLSSLKKTEPPITELPIAMPPAVAPAAPTEEAKKEEPKKEEVKAPAKEPEGAPLLNTLQEPPKGAAAVPAGAPAKKTQAPAEPSTPSAAAVETPSPPPQPAGFAAPRRLFSGSGEKPRAGTEHTGFTVSKKEQVESLPPPPASPEEKLPEVTKKPASAVPEEKEVREVKEIKPPEKVEEKPAQEKPGIWKEPESAPASGGNVIYLQEAGKQGQVEEAPQPEPGHEEQRPAPRTAGLMPSLLGSCGAANGVGTSEKPVNNLCTQGKPGEVNGAGPWNWTCTGKKGSSANCSAPLQINGECGMANGSQSVAAPLGQLCASGKSSEVSGAGPWYWNCFGDNGGVVAQCVAYTMVSGRCGKAHGVVARSVPHKALCAAGHATAVLGEGPWTWNCVGSGEGNSVNCEASRVQDGVCGPSASIGSASEPATDLCAYGKAGKVTGKGPWNWTCESANGGKTVKCSSMMLTNAACGPAHGVGALQKPKEGLCASGASESVTGEGPWYWTCGGENGGAPADCMAPKRTDGVCGPAHQMGAETAPEQGLCTSGMPGTVTGSGPWQWSCAGAAGGLTANCISRPTIHAACGSAHGVSTKESPSGPDLCASGTPTTVIGSGPFMWSCEGSEGGTAVNCMAPLLANGACGSANGVAVASAPSDNLCREGTASDVTGNGPWLWNCKGGGGGITATCSAPQAENTEEPSPPPAEIPPSTEKAGNECVPTVKRWTITCQQGGYPANYSGVIVGETQVLCPTNVERGVWLSNSCSPATDSAPVSPQPGVLENPPPPAGSQKITDVLPSNIEPMPAKQLGVPKKLKTPHYSGATPAPATAVPTPKSRMSPSSITFEPGSEGMDTSATARLDEISSGLAGDDQTIITLNAYAALPADGNQQEARRLALARALLVRSYLMRKGLASSRIDIRALGPPADKNGTDRVDVLVGGK